MGLCFALELDLGVMAQMDPPAPTGSQTFETLRKNAHHFVDAGEAVVPALVVRLDVLGETLAQSLPVLVVEQPEVAMLQLRDGLNVFQGANSILEFLQAGHASMLL